jgi:DamX protein
LKKLSTTHRRLIAWIAAGVVVLLLAEFGFLAYYKFLRPKLAVNKLTKTVIRKKIVPDPKLAPPSVTKKIASIKTPVPASAAIKTQRSSGVKIQSPSPARIISDQPGTGKTVAAEPTDAVPLKKDLQPVSSPQPVAKPAPRPAEPIIAKKKEKTVRPIPAFSTPPKADSQPTARQQSAAKPPETKTAPLIAKKAEREVHREKWLLSQDPASYTIQIIGVSTQETMLNFIERNEWLKQNEAAYYETTFRGKPWYQLLYGIYPTRQAAQLAAQSLPDNIRRAGPWIRRISAVQKAIGR